VVNDAVEPTAEPTTVVQRVFRCMGVSVVSTNISLSVLALSTLVLGLTAWVANIVAVACATGPSYSLNRRWTWGRYDRSDPWREVAPFWAMSFAGLALSTLTVGITSAWAAGIGLRQPLETAAVLAAHMSGFGLLWVAQFVVLDRLVFGRVPGAAR
jgi:putative flippase GtrA